jgi:hypothetical protein
MNKVDPRGLPDAVFDERRRCAVKLREAKVIMRETARQCRLGAVASQDAAQSCSTMLTKELLMTIPAPL